MKKIIVSWILSALLLATAHAQYGTARTGYEGDYFSLEGALDLFKQSYTLMDFERKLNTEENWVNNMDLNYDGRIDYIRVEHRRQGDFHAVILQAVVDRYDVQDVAVIEIEILGPREAILQIVGDEDLYGEEVVVEPVEGYSDSRSGYHADYGDYVNVYYWRAVQYILDREYRVYASPYRWQYYPTWWRPWVQCTWNVFHPRIVIYHRHYHVAPRHRVVHVHHFYQPYRSYSYTVVQRTNEVRIEHGRSPVHRTPPANRQDGNPRDYRDRENITDRPDVTTPRSATPRPNPSVSRKTPAIPADERTTGNAAPRIDQRPRGSVDNPGTPRSTEPTVRSRNASPASPPRATGDPAPRVRPQPESATTPPRATPRTTAPAPSPSPGVRTAPPDQPRTSRNTPPSAQPQSRTMTTRPDAAARSTTPARSPSPSVRTTPSAEPRTSRNTPPSAQSPSRSTTPRPDASARPTTPARSSGGSAPNARSNETPPRGSSKSSPSRKGGGGE